MAIDTRKDTIMMGEKKERRKTEEIERRRAEIRFICMPGVMPVKVPAVTPQSKAMRSSSIILLLRKV